MKNLFVAFAAFTILFLTGCRENSFDPVTGPSPKDAAADAAVTEGVIPLTGELAVPGSGYIYTIKGEIIYIHQLVPSGFDTPDPLSNISLVMNVNAQFTPVNDIAYRDSWIDSRSDDLIYVSQDGVVVLEKKFPVIGSNEEMVLVCTFLVTTDGVSLYEMRLALNDDNG